MYVTKHEDEIVGPFESKEEARAWLNSLSGNRGDQAYIENMDGPFATKALWAQWDAETDEEIQEEKDTRRLKWCKHHREPVWMFDDGSWSCRWQLIVETRDESHCEIVDEVPAEVLFKPKVEEPVIVSTMCSCISCEYHLGRGGV